MTQHNYKMTIAYDGTSYNGWQIQKNSISVQEEIQETFKFFLKENVNLVGAGRTDTGVHALGQVANFYFPDDLELRRFIASANGLLPKDIRIKSIEKVDDNFHSRYSAKGKIYHYHLCIDQVQDPFHRLYRYHVPKTMDLECMKEAAKLFVGTHDFTSFTNSAHEGSASRDAVRTITRISVICEQNGYVRIEFEGNGFLYKMIRNIVGTILEVAGGRIEMKDIPIILDAKDRKKACKAAPPHGLFLMKVLY